MKVSKYLIGPGRSGTSFLFNLMYKYNKSSVSNVKEPQFFDRNYERGVKWYHSLYSPGVGELWDFSNRYYCDPDVPKKLFEYNPKADIFFIERDRKSLFRSMVLFELRKGRCESELKVIMDRKWLESDVHSYLSNWSRYFNVEFIDYQDVISLSESVRKIFHLGAVDTSSVDKNTGIVPKVKIIALFAKWVARFLRKVGAYTILTRLKQSQRVKAVFYKSDISTALSGRIDKYIEERGE